MIMVVVAATCVFVEPTSGIIVGILLSLGKGAFLESKAWVLCKLRQGEAVIAQFNCDLVREGGGRRGRAWVEDAWPSLGRRRVERESEERRGFA